MSAFLPVLAPRIDPVDSAILRRHDVLLRVLRLDLIHPLVHGNKWFKLKHNVAHVLAQGLPAVLSFGGAYSNHLYALAAAGNHFGFRTIGLVRGELVQPLNPVLAFAREQGMELVSVSRADYRRKAEPGFIAALQARFGPFHLVPEGGSNALAVTGCAEIAGLLRWHTSSRPRTLALACGTGTTLAGIVAGLTDLPAQPQPEVLGISVLKAPGYLQGEVARWLPPAPAGTVSRPNWRILEAYHGGGYARSTPAQTAFLQAFSAECDIPLEPVYTGKLLYGLFDLIQRGQIAPGSEVLALHTGGIHP